MGSEPLRILADRIAPMHWGLLAEAINRCESADVVAHDVAPEEMHAALVAHEPDVLILAAPDILDRPGLLDDWMRSGTPDRRIINLFDDLSRVRLQEWRLNVVTLTDVSLDSLCDAIRGSA